ncbi:ABC transporter permease [Halosimplex halobium]|uniref:ABC transporter permease n=1 Tax=Halosimplex halobium TaxID=3396618 RepID=UPI003F54DB38
MATEVDSGPEAVERERTLVQRIFGRREFGVVVAILGLLVVGSVVRADVFLTLGNFVGVLRNAAVVALIGYGMTVLITAGEFDLAVGSVMGISAGITAVMLLDGFSIWFIFLTVALLAVFFGVLQGILVTKVGLPSLIVTIGTLTLLRGAHLAILGSVTQTIPLGETPLSLRALGGTISLPFPVLVPFTDVQLFTLPALSYRLPGVHDATQTFDTIPLQILWVVALGAVFHYILFYTAFGYRVRATGGELKAAEYTGIKTDQVKIAGFVIVALMAAFAGLSQLAFTGNVSPLTGDGQELVVIAAVVIGGTDLFGGEGTMSGTVLGALVFAFTQNILVLAGFGTELFSIFTGLFIIFAVAVDAITRRTRYETVVEQYTTPLRRILRHPREYFGHVRDQVQGVDRPLAFFVLVTATWALPVVVVAALTFVTNPLTGSPFLGLAFDLLFIAGDVGALGMIPVFAYVLAGGSALLLVAFLQPFVWLFDGSGDVDETVQAVCFAAAPTVGLFVPVLLAALDFIFPLVAATGAVVGLAVLGLLVFGMETLHELPRSRAAGAVAGASVLLLAVFAFVAVEL